MAYQPTFGLLPPREEMLAAFARQDTSYEGVFLVAVRTTGIFCRPTCKPPRAPKPENCEFFSTPQEAIFAGYRPCKLCRPLNPAGGTPDWAAGLEKAVEAEPQKRWDAAALRELGVPPERARRWFQQNYGMTFAHWCRARRLAGAFTVLREGSTLDDAALDHGYESLSGFRSAFEKMFGQTPGRAGMAGCLYATIIDTPLGRCIAAASEEGLVMFDFNDRRMLETNLSRIHRRIPGPLVPGDHPHLKQFQQEIAEYYAGGLRTFNTPLHLTGSAFQDRVWQELRRIPYGETIAYEALASRIGQPSAQRAVARANGMNPLAIIVPCHRVIGKDGTLTGYGGGIWRKRLLLGWEKSGGWPKPGSDVTGEVPLLKAR